MTRHDIDSAVDEALYAHKEKPRAGGYLLAAGLGALAVGGFWLASASDDASPSTATAEKAAGTVASGAASSVLAELAEGALALA